MSLELFVNDKYRVLELIYSHRIEVKGESYTSLSQVEIANLIEFSKQKTNKLVKELMDEGFMEYYQNLRGEYKVNAKGQTVINTIKNTKI